MKKSLLVSIISLIAIITIFSCKKTFEPKPDSDQLIKPVDETEIKVQAFLNNMKSNLKSGSTYSIEDAIWYAEATLNFSYAIYDSDFVYLSKDTSSFSIDLNQNGTVNQNDLASAYENMVDSLEVRYNGIQGSPKHVIMCDIVDVSNSVGTLDLMMVSVIAYNYTPNIYGSFGSTDYWYSGDLAGKCDEYEGQYIGRDATTELEYKLLHPLIAPVQNVRIYYDQIVTVSDVDPENYPYEPSPRGNRGYSYFSWNPSDFIQCLYPEELNFYISANGIPYIIDDNNTFINKEFFFIDVIWLAAFGNDYYYEAHHYDISYGVRHETEIGISPF